MFLIILLCVFFFNTWHELPYPFYTHYKLSVVHPEFLPVSFCLEFFTFYFSVYCRSNVSCILAASFFFAFLVISSTLAVLFWMFSSGYSILVLLTDLLFLLFSLKQDHMYRSLVPSLQQSQGQARSI